MQLNSHALGGPLPNSPSSGWSTKLMTEISISDPVVSDTITLHQLSYLYFVMRSCHGFMGNCVLVAVITSPELEVRGIFCEKVEIFAKVSLWEKTPHIKSVIDFPSRCCGLSVILNMTCCITGKPPRTSHLEQHRGEYLCSCFPISRHFISLII